MSEDDKPQYVKPDNIDNIVKSLDRIDDDVKQPKNLKSALVGLYVILKLNYNSRLTSNRARALRANLKRKVDSNRFTPYSKQTKIEQDDDLGDNEKVNRFTCIPECYFNCESNQAKIALVLYLMQSHSENLRKAVIMAIMNNHMTTTSIQDLIKLCKQSVSDIRKHIKDFNVSSQENQRKILVSALIEISEMLKDKSCSKLALEISPQGYATLINDYLKNNWIHSMAPCDAIINKFIKECIPLHDQDKMRTVIYNQCKVNMSQVIHDIISKLPKQEPKLQIQQNANKAPQFAKNQKYQYYLGPMHYTRDLMTGYLVSENKRYKILTYNDCLYDVMGSTDLSTQQSELYDTMSWMERLEKLPYRAKVIVSECTGSDLNDMNVNADITTSYIDEEGLSHSRTYSFKKKEKKSVA